MTIKSSYLIIALVLIIAATGGGYFYYRSKSIETSDTLNPSPKISKTQSIETCIQFETKYGISAGELVQYINSEPDSAIVLKDYKKILVNITDLTSSNNQAVILELNGQGIITKYICDPVTIKAFKIKDKNSDLELSIPESDFAQVVRNRETLETEQAVTYLQNVTTNPQEAKNKLLLRIRAL